VGTKKIHLDLRLLGWATLKVEKKPHPRGGGGHVGETAQFKGPTLVFTGNCYRGNLRFGVYLGDLEGVRKRFK